jgi:hypothetical protein
MYSIKGSSRGRDQEYFSNQRKSLVTKLDDSSFRVGIHIRLREAHQFAKLTRGEFQNRFIDDSFNEVFCSLKFSRYHKFYHSFNKAIKQLHTAGITEHFIDKWKKYLQPKFYEKPIMLHKKYLETTYKNSFEDGPKVLSLRDLEFGFVVWCASLILPLLIFIVEILLALKDFIIMKCVLKTFFDQQQNEYERKFASHKTNLKFQRIIKLNSLELFDA